MNSPIKKFEFEKFIINKYIKYIYNYKLLNYYIYKK